MKFLSALAFILLIGCQPTAVEQMPEAERNQCQADGGRVISQDARQICLAPFSDAGQSCRAADECQGTCQSTDGGMSGQCMALPVQSSCGLNYFDATGTLTFGVCI